MLDWLKAHGLFLSLLGNVLLVGAVSWSLLSRQSAAVVTTPARQGSAREVAIVPTPPSWDWSRVQSADDAIYANNLRALGCPEDSVIDLITGVITERYAQRWRREAGAPLAYWQSAGLSAATEQARLRAARARLERERREAIERALGAQALDALAKHPMWNDADNEALWLAFLPEQKRAQLAAIYARYAAAAIEDPALLNEVDVSAAATSKARERADIAALLTVRELEDLDLRRSETAERLRQELRGFEATETEFKEVFRIRRAYESSLTANADVRDPNVLEVRIQAERRFVEEARTVLGEQRYADYQRARDPDFQNALQLSQYRGLPADTAARMYELKRAVEARANGITSHPTFPEQRQRDLLRQIQSETEATLRGMLGAEILAEYRRNNRWWRFDE